MNAAACLGLTTRCRRGSSSPASPTLSSYSSSEGTSILTGDADDLSSLMTASDGELPPGYYYDDDTMTSLPSEAETVTMGVSELASILEADSLLLGDADKMVLQLWADDHHDISIVNDLYKPLFDCVVNNKRQELYKVSTRNCCQRGLGMDEVRGDTSRKLSAAERVLSIPSLAVVVFLREEPMRGEDTWAKMKDHFNGGAWKFHHSEQVSRGKLHAYENNSQDYLLARTNMPLCAMRQIHCGKRILRFLRFVSSNNWRDNVNLYRLLLAKDPDILKQDFCLFTASYHAEYEVQLSLKKIPKGIECRPMTGAALCFRVSQVGHTVPLLPKVCTPVNDDRWETTDLDGNIIYLDVVRLRDRSCEPVPEVTDLGISHLLSSVNNKNRVKRKSTKTVSCPQTQAPTSLSAFQTIQHIKECGLEFGGEIKPDEKYGSTQCDFIHMTNREYPDILAYDSLDELELLMSDIASNCSEVISHKETQNELIKNDPVRSDLLKSDIVNGDFLKKVSERDACGAVDGSSYHSEGNHEDHGHTPSPPNKSPIIRTKPAIPPKPSKFLRQTPKYNDIIVRTDLQHLTLKHNGVMQNEMLHENSKSDVITQKGFSSKDSDISSSESSSCKSELVIVNQMPKQGILSTKVNKVSSPVDEGKHCTGSEQIPMTHVKTYQEPNYWAGLSESASNVLGSGLHSLTQGLTYTRKLNNTIMVVQYGHGSQQNHKTVNGCQKSKGSLVRPELPSYSELQKKSQFQQYHHQQSFHSGLPMSRQGVNKNNHYKGSSEDLLRKYGVYCDMGISATMNHATLNQTEHSRESGKPSGSSERPTMGQGLQVSSHPQCSTAGLTSGHSSGSSTNSAPSSCHSMMSSTHSMGSSDHSTDSPSNSLVGGGMRNTSAESNHRKPPLPPPPYRPPTSLVVLSPRTPPTYNDATSGSKYKPSRSMPKQDFSMHNNDSQDSPICTKQSPMCSQNSPANNPTQGQHFQFDGATMPRFGRNSKLRQSVMPPPYFDHNFSDSYEEQAIGVPGAPTTYNENPKMQDASLGFYV